MYIELIQLKQNKTKNNLIKKWAEDVNRPGRYTNGQEVQEKLLNMTNYEVKANQNHNSISPHNS